MVPEPQIGLSKFSYVFDAAATTRANFSSVLMLEANSIRTGHILAGVGTGSGTGSCVRQDLFVASIKLRQFVCLWDVTISPLI